MVGRQFPAPGPDDLVDAIERVAARCLSVGVTSAHDLFVTHPGQPSAMAAARDSGRLGIRFPPYLALHLLHGLLAVANAVPPDPWLPRERKSAESGKGGT